MLLEESQMFGDREPPDKPEIRWHPNFPHPGVSTVTPLTADARGFLEWMTSDGPTPVLGVWKGESLIVLDADEEDYLGTTVAGNGFVVEVVENGPPTARGPRG